jgi:ABC-type polysaccharide/polyol phosphate export permease
VKNTDERISKWRARREAQQTAQARHGGLPSTLAVVAARAEEFATDENEDAEPMLQLVLEALRDEPNQTAGDRRRVYDAVAHGVEHGIAGREPNSEFAELRRRQLRAIVRAIEADMRTGANVAEAGYRPAGLEEAIQSLVDGYRRRRRLADEAERSQARRAAVLAGEAFAVSVPRDEEGDLDYLLGRLARVDAKRQRHRGSREHVELRDWATLLGYQFTLLISESRIALIWMMVGPAVLIGLISLFYFLSGVQYVLNMNVPTFAVTGACTWLMFRNVIFRSCAAFHAHTWMLNFRPFRPWMVGVAVGVWIMVAYACVFCVLVGGGYLLGVMTLPDDWVGVAFWFTCVGCAGLALGVFFGALAVVWPYSPRLAPAIERFLEVFSSVALVSEQVPEEYRWIALWSPLAHALQLLRASYFHSYASVDASPIYFFVGLGVMILGAFAFQRAVRSQSHPI